MRKQMHKFGVVSAVLAFAVLGSATTFAEPLQAEIKNQETNGTTTCSKEQETKEGTTVTCTTAAEHQAANKLKVCENRKKAITNSMERIAERGQKQLDLFTTIATRTETFYTDKGKTLSNYTTLVADVNAKKATAQTTVDTIKAASASFSCDASDPKGSISLFKTSLKAETTALKDYRTAVKNLIVGVKSVQSTTVPATDKTKDGGTQ